MATYRNIFQILVVIGCAFFLQSCHRSKPIDIKILTHLEHELDVEETHIARAELK